MGDDKDVGAKLNTMGMDPFQLAERIRSVVIVEAAGSSDDEAAGGVIAMVAC